MLKPGLPHRCGTREGDGAALMVCPSESRDCVSSCPDSRYNTQILRRAGALPREDFPVAGGYHRTSVDRMFRSRVSYRYSGDTAWKEISA